MPLPEEFAPTGPKLTRFAIQPPPPIRPHLFADEARFAFRLAMLVFGTELAFWIVAAQLDRYVYAAVALRMLKPIWARLGRAAPRPAIAAVLIAPAIVFALFGALLLHGVFPRGTLSIRATLLLLLCGFGAVGLPAFADLCASCVADSVTVERRATAYSWLEMGQAAGAAFGLAAGNSRISVFVVPVALLASLVGIPQLKDRGTPRSSWPAASYLNALKSPLGLQLSLCVLACSALGLSAGRALFSMHLGWPEPRWWIIATTPLAGMVIAARFDPWMRNAIVLPAACALVAAVAWALGYEPLGLAACGAIFAALPASVARGAGEMERPIVSSIAWSALSLGVALGALLRY